uniref:hypothetical protein n=1 Tax=Polyozellus multiplex TaxID=281719 RepID=UPI001F12AF28|nr:hypothetical protein MN596_mgp11 [Polyozellus multiplex]UMI33312.1 hypothetical protein [Polyozellus multiplex]
MKINIILNKWFDYNYNFDNQILIYDYIGNVLKKFLSDRVVNLEEDLFILIQFKLKLSDDLYRSISYVKTIRIKIINYYLILSYYFGNIRSENYHITTVSSIIFTYKTISKES